MEVEYVLNRYEQFAVHKLNDEGFKKEELIKDKFDRLLSLLENICMDGREFSIVKTKLEEACFFAKKSMAINLINQKTEESN